MIKYLDDKNGKQYGVDFTFKVIPKSFSPYKLMSIYCIDNIENKTIIAAFVLLKYKDTNSLLKIFGILRATFNFSPKTVTTDFDYSLIKAIKNCNLFIDKPYVIACLFHYSQAILKKCKKLNLYKKKINHRTLEILHNLEILCFINEDKIKDHFEFLKDNISENENKKI